MLKLFVALITLVVMSGCAGFGGVGLESMSADQITALSKMKDANVAVTDTNTVWGRVKTVILSVDKSVIDKGGVVVTPDGGVSFTNEKLFKPEPTAVGTTQTVTTTVVPAK